MTTPSLLYEIGKRYYFTLFGVGRISAVTAEAIWVEFQGYRVAFDQHERHLEIRVG